MKSFAAQLCGGPRGHGEVPGRFTPEVEKAFLESRKETMMINLSRCMACLGAVVLSAFVMYRIWDWGGMPWNEQVSMGASIGFFVLVTGLAVVTRIPFCKERMSFASLEVATCLVMTWVLIQELMFDHLVIKLLVERHLEAHEWAEIPHRVAVVALSLDGVITAAHLALPIRWSVMVWMDVLFVLLFTPWAVVMCLAQGKMDVYVICMLAMLTCAASFGLKATESKDRVLFKTIVMERSLRAEAQFQVEMSNSVKSSHTPTTKSPIDHNAADEQESSVPPSLGMGSDAAVSTYTQNLFAHAGNADVKSFLDLEQLGLQEQWLIRMDELAIFEADVIGRGGYCVVVGADFCKGPVAVKKALISGPDVPDGPDSGPEAGKRAIMKRELLVAVLNEVRILRHVRHPNIALFHGACLDPESKQVMLVLERVNGPSLDSVITVRKWFRPTSPEADKQVKIMRQIVQALIYLHSRMPCIVHGDLKPKNIIIEARSSSELFPKLLDFGVSRTVTRHARLHAGTPSYMAPEVVRERDSRPRPASDMFSLGRLLFAVFSGRRPLGRYKTPEILEKLRQGQVHELMWVPSTALLEQHRTLIERCTALKPVLRPTASEVHDVFIGLPVSSTRRGSLEPIQETQGAKDLRAVSL